MAILRCTMPFGTTVDGATRVVSGGELVDSDDPIVKGREDYFEPVESFMTRRAGRQAETATAAPGEVRTVTTAAKRATRKADDK